MAKKIETIFSIQDKYTKTMNKIINSSISAEQKINKASYATDKFNEKMNKLRNPPSSKISESFNNIKTKADSANNSVSRLLRTVLSLAAVKKGIDIIDTNILTNSRLKMINDGTQTDEQLQNKIMQSADNSRGDYATTAANVSRLGLLAKDNFSSNDEIIRFSELLNKSFKVGGASTQEQQAGTYQLSQAMAAGKLQGDEFRSIMENAPLVADAIAKYTGKTKGQLKEMSSEGTITADVIKNAMFAAADEIEGRFSNMPKTFGDYWTMMKNKAIRAFNPVINKVNELINTPQFQEFFDKLMIGMEMTAQATMWLIDTIGWLGQVLEPFVPIILAVAAAYLTYKAYTMIAAAGQAILNSMMTVTISKGGLMIGVLAAIAVLLTYLWFTNDQAAYWMLYAWDMLSIGAMTLWLGLKTVFYGIILAGQTMALGFLGICYILLSAWYGFQTGVEAVSVAVLYIFQGLYNGVLMIVNGIIDVLNKIPGVKIDKAEYATFADNALSNMVDNVTKRNEDLQSMMDDMTALNNSINENKSKFAQDLNNSATDIQNKVFEVETTRDSRVQNRNNWLGDLDNKINGALDIGSSIESKSIPIKAEGGELDKIDEVDISDEDLKYIKDFAEQEFINKFTTATLAPNINVQFGDVHETADADKLKDRIAQLLQDEISEVSEGVYDY